VSDELWLGPRAQAARRTLWLGVVECQHLLVSKHLSVWCFYGAAVGKNVFCAIGARRTVTGSKVRFVF